jgi:hypothetical protein
LTKIRPGESKEVRDINLEGALKGHLLSKRVIEAPLPLSDLNLVHDTDIFCVFPVFMEIAML